MRRRLKVILVLGAATEIGLGTAVATVVLTNARALAAPTTHAIRVGSGFTDVSSLQLVRTSTDILYAVAPTCDAYPACPNNTLRVYRADRPGTPTSFTEQDVAHRPAGGIGTAAIAIDGTDTIHALWNERAGTVNYGTFSTATNTWGAITAIAPTRWTDFGQGDEGVALALDANGMPHAVWSATGSDGVLHLFYGNKVGSWSPQGVDDMPLSNNRRALHPTTAFKADNTLVVAWLEGTFNYVPDGIIRVRTRDANGVWSATQTIADGAMTTIDSGPSLLVTPDGTANLTFVNTNDEVRFWYNSGSGWRGDRQPPVPQTHSPSLGPDDSGGIAIYGHGTPTPIDGHGDHLYRFHLAAGATAWEPWTLYVTDSYDSSVTTRWAQFFQTHLEEVDIAYWGDAYPNTLYIGTDFVVGGTTTPEPRASTTTPTSTATGAATSTSTQTATATSTPMPTNTPTPTPIVTSGSPTATSPPATDVLIGDQTVAMHLDSNPAGLAEAFQFTASADGNANRLASYIDAGSTATTVAVALYTDAAGNPRTHRTQATITNPVMGAWNTVAVPPIPIAAGERLWIAVLGPSRAGIVPVRDRDAGGRSQLSAQNNLAVQSATCSAGATFGSGPLSSSVAQTG